MSDSESEESSESSSKIGRVWVDYFSWGHVAMGIGIYALVWFIVSFTSTSAISLYCFLITFIVGGWLWEVIENNLIWSWGMKFEDKQDSINNLLGDQFWVCLGAIIIWIVEIIIIGNYAVYWFYIVAGILLLICLIGFFISKAISEKNNP
ncbi:MAG: hypothetical protein GF364_11735 [Candidatus Lokiarchaeota archaeon]|nr:hypothetical protein [Candidatus Lokiarchaeota archaeon]